MTDAPVVAVLIVAAGRGTRVCGTRARDDGATGDAPKQYRFLAGRVVLARSIAAFENHAPIHAIQVMIHADDRALYDQLADQFHKLQPVQIGGKTRQQSVYLGLQALAKLRPDMVLIHDAVRPLVSADLISRVIDALHQAKGVLPALPVMDSLRRGEGGVCGEAIARDNIYAAQTPQGFHFTAIMAAHEQAAAHECADGGHEFSDDAEVARAVGCEVALVPGSRDNIKLTEAEDFTFAERLLMDSADVRVGHGIDAHGFAPGDHVMLCGVKIAHTQTLSGHSDADAGLHALTDALLGAISAGDIGMHFPATDPQWKGAGSGIFLRHAADLVRAEGGRIRHVDVTLICEAPKLGPHRNAMKQAVAGMLGLEENRVSIKATTTEKLGFTGRGEGIAAQATATVVFGGGT